MIARCLRIALLLTIAHWALFAAVAGQSPDPTHPWSLRIRAVISGDSHDSDPAGYRIYSGVALEAAVVRRLTEVASLELSLRTESREVEGPTGGSGDHRLGSLEMLPLTLTGRWHPRRRGEGDLQPYVGAGINFTGPCRGAVPPSPRSTSIH